jgi:GNAT superfamily N-acetyltransferase
MEIRELCTDECELIRCVDRTERIRAAWMKTKDSDRCLDFIYLDIEGYGDGIADCVRILKKVIADKGYVAGAFDRGRIIGIASVLPTLGYGQSCSQLVSLDVSYDHRKRGVGRKLLYKCIEESIVRNCSKMVVASNPHENTVKFFKSVGFVYTVATDREYRSLGFPSFRFPEPFGHGVEESIDLELDIAASSSLSEKSKCAKSIPCILWL